MIRVDIGRKTHVSCWVAHEYGGIHLARRRRRTVYDVLQFPGKYCKCTGRHQVEQSHATMSDVVSQFVYPQGKVSAVTR
jgi:hypothetical protein